MLTLIRIGWRHPVVPRAAVVAFVVGALGGTVPTGFLARATGAGIGAGATWGLWAFALVSPILVVYAVSELCAARFSWGVDVDLHLAGQPHAVTLLRDGVTGAGVALMMIAAAALGGVVVGVADSVARGTTLGTAVSPDALVAAVGTAVWWTALVVLVVALVRSATATYLIVVSFFLAGIAAVQVADAQAAWDILAASPFAAFTVIADGVVSGRRGLVTHDGLALAACVVWPAAIGWFVLRRRPGLG
jgi:hypothetical protein